VSVRRSIHLLVALALAVVTLLPLGPARAQSVTSVLDRTVRHTFNVLPGLDRATDLGAAPAGTPMRLVVALRRPHAAAERRFVSAAHNPSSPSYRHFLTPAQFDRRFGVAGADVAAVRRYLTAGGLTVDRVSAAGDILTVHGSAARVGQVFHTTIRSFGFDGTRFLANTVAPTFPQALKIANVIGLNTLTHFSLPAKAVTGQGTCAGGTCTGGTTPHDLWSVYQRARLHGHGQGLAVFGEGVSKSVIGDLRKFEATYHLPKVRVTVKHPKGDKDFSDDAGHAEWNIDTQASTAMATGARHLTLYFGHDLSDQDVAKVFSQFTDDASGPRQASASYGECEQVPYASAIYAGIPVLGQLPAGLGLGNALDGTLDQITRQAAAEGKTIFASTGDTGSSCPVAYAPVVGAGNGVVNQGAPITNSPASLPYVTAVGGTVLYTDGEGHRSREYGWAFSGGGSTLFTAEPDYQKGVSGVNVPCVSDPSTTCRGIADVAAQSGDVLGNGFDIVMQGSFCEGCGGGTSLSAPLMQGMWADVQGAVGGRGLGFANYALYRAGKMAEAKAYFDVSSMDTSTGLPATNGAYTTQDGWDYVTGWGTPRISGLARFLTR
jgi:pseudomonalisin